LEKFRYSTATAPSSVGGEHVVGHRCEFVVADFDNTLILTVLSRRLARQIAVDLHQRTGRHFRFYIHFPAVFKNPD
jgi:hypothetical protein